MKLKLRSNLAKTTDSEFIKLIEPNTEIVVVAPWNGKPVPVTIRMLDGVSLGACGDFNTVAAVIDDDKHKDPSRDDIIEAKNIHENILKLCLVHPTFDVLIEYLMGKDFFIDCHKKIEETKVLIEQLDKQAEKQKFSEQLDMYELSISFLIPEDFTTCIISIVMQQEATEINKLTRNTLLSAGFLGERYNVRPSDYLEGIFTEKQKMDIDATALSLVTDFRQQQIVEKSGTKWIGRKG